MFWRHEWKALALVLAAFLGIFFLPVGQIRFDQAILEGLHLTKWYAREHLVLCLIPAFFIAGAIAVFVRQAAIMKYLGARARPMVAYGTAAVSGSVLAVCSCTVLPLFAGIYQRGAGLGPATTFLYSGPAINVLAVILTARILGAELGLARAIGAIVCSVLVGGMMHLIFRREEVAKAEAQQAMPVSEPKRPLRQEVMFFALMIAILVFANWAEPGRATGLWYAIASVKWFLTAFFAIGLALVLASWFQATWWRVGAIAVPVAILAILPSVPPLVPFGIGIIGLSVITSTRGGELGEWFGSSWGYAKQIFPLLLIGVFVAGLLLGRPGESGLIPSEWVSGLVGGNSIRANLFASVVGAFMYFATLTEVPIPQGPMGGGIGKGQAVALLLAGPALSLPNMLVIRSVIGTKKTAVYVLLVIAVSAASGMIYGFIAN